MATHEQDQERLKKATGITLVSIAANVALALLKIVVGLYSLNRALVADGIHSSSDLASDFITLITVRIGAREADVRMHYGYRRVETVEGSS